MVDYIYDGTFEGLLTCIYYNYYGEKAAGIFQKETYQASMFNNFVDKKTEDDKAEKVYKAISKKISYYDLQRIYKVYKSTVKEKENKILDYVKLGFSKGQSISLLHGDPVVFAVQEAEKKVNNEIHRLCGLIRFTALGNKVFYSPIEPDHDLVEFLAKHFCDRFKNQPFIIHDKKRSKALFSSEGQWYVSEFFMEGVLNLEDGEEMYRELWKNYFDTIAIKERINPRCQKGFMPVRYWKHLTEKQITQKDIL